jgi:hypothetical protein
VNGRRAYRAAPALSHADVAENANLNLADSATFCLLAAKMRLIFEAMAGIAIA